MPPGIDVDLPSDALSAEMPASKKPKTSPPEHANGTTAHASEQAGADLDGEAVRLFGEVAIKGETQAGARLESSQRALQSSETIQQHLQCAPPPSSNQGCVCIGHQGSLLLGAHDLQYRHATAVMQPQGGQHGDHADRLLHQASASTQWGSEYHKHPGFEHSFPCRCRGGKLCLVLDLDHTLLNSARWGEVAPGDADVLEQHLAREGEVPYEERSLHSLQALQMWTKLRPRCREFLAALSKAYVMWIHTNGNK